MPNPTLRKLLISLLASTLLTVIAVAQTQPAGIQMANRSATTQALPAHVVYRHFLHWVKALHDKDQAEEVIDSYHFAAPFAEAGLQNADWDVIVDEAKSLEIDLEKQDQRASVVIQDFRRQASAKLRTGEPLQPAPNMLELQQERDTLIKSHVSILHARLGATSGARLDQYLSRVVAPHISLKPIALPKPNVTLERYRRSDKRREAGPQPMLASRDTRGWEGITFTSARFRVGSA